MTCSTNFLNPSTSCDQLEGMLKMVVLVKKGFAFAAPTNAETLADWITAIQAKNIIPLKALFGSEPANEGAQYEQSPLATLFIRDGRMERKVQIATNLDLHSKLRSLNSGDWDVFFVFENGAIVGFNDGTGVSPFEMELVHVEYQTDNEGSVSSKTPIHLTFADARQYQDSPIIIKPTWNPFTKLKPLANVALEVVSSNATTIVVRAYVPHILYGYKNPVEGLVVGDWLSTTAAGVVETISTSVEDTNVPGTYTLTGSGLVTGFINLKMASLMTTKGFESTGAKGKTVA